MNITNLLSLLLGLLVFSSCKNNQGSKTAIPEISPVEILETSFHKARSLAMNIEGMVCAMGCAAVIEKNLNRTTGIKDAVVDFETKKATLIFDADILSPNDVTQVVLNTGEAYTVKDFQLMD